MAKLNVDPGLSCDDFGSYVFCERLIKNSTELKFGAPIKPVEVPATQADHFVSFHCVATRVKVNHLVEHDGRVYFFDRTAVFSADLQEKKLSKVYEFDNEEEGSGMSLVCPQVCTSAKGSGGLVLSLGGNRLIVIDTARDNKVMFDSSIDLGLLSSQPSSGQTHVTYSDCVVKSAFAYEDGSICVALYAYRQEYSVSGVPNRGKIEFEKRHKDAFTKKPSGSCQLEDDSPMDTEEETETPKGKPVLPPQASHCAGISTTHFLCTVRLTAKGACLEAGAGAIPAVMLTQEPALVSFVPDGSELWVIVETANESENPLLSSTSKSSPDVQMSSNPKEEDITEEIDTELLRKAREHLAEYTSEMESTGFENFTSYGIDQFEPEEDASMASTHILRFAADSLDLKNDINLSSFHNYMCCAHSSSSTLPLSIGLKRGENMLVYSMEQQPQTSTWNLVHRATFPGLAYVSASKQHKKFTALSSNFSRAIITEHASFSFIYENPSGSSSAGQQVIQFSKDCGIFGVKLSSHAFYLLTKEA
eukprot:204690_1